MLIRLFYWLFADRTDGRIVVAQWPNLALWIFLAALLTGTFVRQGMAGSIVQVAGEASLTLWAIDEVLRGVNPWRRLLGGAVLVTLCSRGLLALAQSR